jgi:hypothetical protein
MGLTWRKHPVLKPPTPEEMAEIEPSKLITLYEAYHEAIYNSEKDPYRYGFVLPHWHLADSGIDKFRTLLLLGANRSAKTSFCARKIVQAAEANPKSLIYCFSQNKEISVLVQQSAVYNWLPVEHKQRILSNVGNINYSFKNGFTDNTFVLPNGSKIVFKFYTQWIQDDTILEGMELGCREPNGVNIGAWLDEYLLGMDLIDRLYLRLATFNAKLLISFTPKDGETETVKNFRLKAKTLEYRTVEEGLSKPQRVPYYQENTERNTAIVYFHSKDNPWSGYETLLEQCLSKAEDNYTLTALYGVPTKTIASLFPRFQPGINVLPHAELLTRLKDVTRYMVIDPAGSKPWFMCWIAVDSTETWYVYREWPGVQYGDWAMERGGKWVAGEACRQKLGYGVQDYAELIKELEGEEEIMERIIDPRMGAAKYSTSGGGQSDYISDLEKEGLVVIPAPGIEEEPGIQAIQDKLAYNDKKPIDGNNRPRFYISDECENIILALQEYDGSSREHPLKDPIDVLRYGAVRQLFYIDHKDMAAKSTRKAGY